MASSYEGAKQTIARGEGVARLSIGRMADLGYPLSRDDDSHGCITGLPEYQSPASEDHLNRASKAADQLLDLAAECGITIDKWRPK